ncbi:hypothetical protein BRARA_D01689 [Brassica rapa]|uniref:Uncharacterized protein n=1 Tax=Brassica campestris TaxID=3711 RepID=A0A397ZUF8_BRACM|nr:hypothetical protein BRARA_D01689 [Brassica rapa]
MNMVETSGRPHIPEVWRPKCALRLVFQTSIYVLWKEKNSRRHGGASVERTTKVIGKLVKNRISSLKYMGNHKLEPLLRRWFDVYTD